MAEISKNKVVQYSNNCYTMAQQKGSKLSNLCTRVTMSGERTALERVGETEAVRAEGRYGDSPVIETPFDRRSLFGFEYHWGDMVDWKENEEILLDPTGPITQAGAKALGRTMDRVIIERGIFGDAYEGEDGLTAVPFPEAQKLSITAGSDNASNVGLTIEKLIQAKSLIGNADIDLDDPSEKLYFCYTQKQLDDLIRSVNPSNKDYTPIVDLYYGKTNTFMGFEFIRISKKVMPSTELGSGVSRQCFAFAKSCVAFGEPIPITGRIAERADKQFNWYSYMKMKCGSTRYQDEGVVHVPCLEG